ncbi:MAG TPA: hypothetical protein VLV56_08155, partial [Burkholderiales bacterium]|nr:hypothetical protein [Burkholderiales bacterium]
ADLGRLLVSETDPNQPLRLVQDARPADVDEALAMLQAFRSAFEASSPYHSMCRFSPLSSTRRSDMSMRRP